MRFITLVGHCPGLPTLKAFDRFFGASITVLALTAPGQATLTITNRVQKYPALVNTTVNDLNDGSLFYRLIYP